MNTTGSRERRGTAIGLVAILLWSSLALLTVKADGVPRFELLALTFGTAFIGGMVVLGLQGRQGLRQLKQPRKAWLAAFLAIFAYHVLYFFALANAPAAQASLIAFLWPLLLVLLSVAVGGRRLRPTHLFGAVLGLSGTATLLIGRDAGPIEPDALAGYIAALACAFVWAGYSVHNRRFDQTPSSMLVGVCGVVAAAGALCHFALEQTVVPDASQWAAIVALGLGPAGLAFLAWDHGTKHGNLPLLGALSYLAPFVSTLLLIAAGQAEASLPVLVGMGLIVGGAAVATLRPPLLRERA
ncbi:aromatic amino acid exporter YddG [Rhodoligotrophos defluvii]|uniref:aromatic amino acid exporter YddG n=1 Tax=Rhodoligotrophos defluvii TaxID=2561934 RepID=UPI0010C9FADE|nr:DMT family transporter [Rhodoligotrophos defluvii]